MSASKYRTAALKKRVEENKRLFTQTATALVNAIDAKDKYTQGHSSRVADYSKKIAELKGMSEDECEEVYYAALLHDVGKIGKHIVTGKNAAKHRYILQTQQFLL